MRTRRERMSDKLNKTRLIVEGARKPETLQALIDFGYPQHRLNEGLGYQQAAEQAYLKAHTQRGEAYGAGAQLKAAMAEVYPRYIDHVEVARAAFKHDGEMLRKLGVLGRRKRDRTGWVRQARDFYEIAMADPIIRDLFAANGVRVELGLMEVANLQVLEGELKRELGEARLARQERQAAFERLERWIAVFVPVARVAFRRQRGLLEQLGL